VYIVIGILIFGVLIAVHELGHFLAAKKLGVRVNEFAIGMGPKLLKKQRGETLYTWRLLPIGGACVMEGEDAEAESARSFTAQTRPRRVVILAAGAFFNFLVGVVLIAVLCAGENNIVGTTVGGLFPGFPNEGENGLMAGDTLLSVNGERLYYADDFSTFMALPSGADGVVDLVLRRGGEKITLRDFPLAPREYTIDGVTVTKFGISFNGVEPTFGAKLKYTGYMTMNFVRLARVGIQMLVTGDVGVRDLSGPVGIVSAINEVGRTPNRSFADKARALTYFAAFLAVNLAVMNLLPIPALDGGRIFALAVTFCVEKIIRRRLNPKYEGYVHAAGFILLMGLMLVVMVSDVMKLFHG
jgi:regulator of sigma E protease